MRTDYAEAVLEVASLVARGSAVSYGDVAELLGAGGPRQVGAAMARSGGHGGRSVPWWRVVRSNGTLPADLAVDAAARWAEEGTPLRNGHVAMPEARWRPTQEDFAAIDALAERLRLRERQRVAEPKRRAPLL